MKTKGFVLLILFSLLLCRSAAAYETAIAGNIYVEDKISGIGIGHDPSGIAAAISSSSRTLYIIDVPASAVIDKIPLDFINSELVEPTAVTIDSKRNLAIVSSSDGMLNFVDLDTGSSVKTIAPSPSPSPARGEGHNISPPLRGGDRGEGDIFNAIAIHKETDILYIASGKNIMLMNLETGNISKEVSLPDAVIGMGIDYKLGYLLALTEETGELSIYNSETLEFIKEISSDFPSIKRGLRGVSVNPSTHIAVLANNSDNSISIISLESRTVLDTISLEEPGAIAIDPVTNIALISHKNGIAIIKLENPVPKINFLIPDSARSGDSGFMLSIEGEKFIKESQTQFNKKDVPTYFKTNESLEAQISEEDLTAAGNVPVTVTNPLPGGGISNTLQFSIFNPAPVLDSITPDTIPLPLGEETSSIPSPLAGEGEGEREPLNILTLRAKGKNFFNGSVVNLNGENLNTRFISSILLEAEINPSLIKSPGKYPVVVVNPWPGSYTSNAVHLDVVEDAVSLQDLSSLSLRAEGEAISAQNDSKETGTLKGRILNTNKEPLEGVTVKIKNITAVTDSDGYFTLQNVPSGRRHLLIRGKTAKEADSHYPTIPLTVDIQADAINEMPFQIYLHRQKNYNFKNINPAEETVLTDPEVPGFEIKIPKGVKITGWDGNPNKRVSVRTVPTDRLPVKPLPSNANVRTVYMFYFDKEGGGIPDEPIAIKSKNDLGLLPGEKAVLWYYDESPNEGEAPNDWAIAGTGTVTPDGKYIVSDPGVGIPKFCCGATGWGGTSGGDNSGGCDGDGACCAGGSGGGPGGGGGGPSPAGPSNSAGDPVDLATGYFLHSNTDLHIPGVIPVNITRHYRSRESGSAVTGAQGLGAFGKGTYFEYDWWMGAYGADGQLNDTNPTMLLLIKPGNYQYRFTDPDGDGVFTNDSDPAMDGAVATYDSVKYTRTLRMRDGWTYKFDYSGDMDGELIEIADRNGNKLTLTRHSGFEGGYLTKITTVEGRTITFNQTYTSGPIFRTDSIADSAGRTVTYAYEDDPFSSYLRLKSVAYPGGGSIEYRYDSQGRMSEIWNERGVREVLNKYYDTPVEKQHRIKKQTHADGGTFEFDYTIAGGNITETTMTSPNGAVRTWDFYDDEGNFYDKYIVKQTTPDGSTIYERESGTNRILSVTDPLGRAISYTYDSKGRVLTITDSSGNITRYEYEDIYSNVTKITDAIGNVTTMSYDSNGNMTSRTAPDGKTTTYTYNAIGKPLTVTDPLGNTTTMEYDTSGNLINVTDPLGNYTQMTYDSLGRMTRTTDAGGKSTIYGYDPMGRIAAVIDPLENITSYSYYLDGKLAMVTDAKNHTIKYEYDERGRLIEMTDQLGNIETYSYDTSDNLVSMTDRKGQTTTHTYDLMHRMTRATYHDGSYTSYTYDAGGRLLTVTDSISGAISYTYGNGDKATGETTPLGSISYTEDAIGRRTSMTVAGQPVVNYNYDANSRLTNLVIASEAWQTLSFGFTYDFAGRRTSLTLPNGVTTNYSYDNASRLLGLDVLDSLNSELETLNYSYDPNGNRTSMTRPSVTLPLPNAASNTSYNDANQMLSFNDKGITYDANGNMTTVTNSCGTTNYTWDVRNRLVGINGFKPDCSSLTAAFKYDALGRRIEKTINGVTTKYVYDGIDIIQEKNQSGAVTANYIRTLNIDEPLARIKADGTVRYYQTDALGSIISLSTVNGELSTVYTYDPFGNTTVSGESSDNPFQYTGRENDQTVLSGVEGGLYYYRARYYSPELQRFISEDPLECERKYGRNFFVYVGNNPVNYADPEGLFWPIDCIRCFYYMSQCAKKGVNCKETSCKTNEDVTSSELFNKCFKGIPECQKQLEYCGKCVLVPKGTPTSI